MSTEEQYKTFLSHEFELLNKEMLEAVKETRILERYALLATGAIWSWVAANDYAAYESLKWLPVLLVFFLAFRALALIRHIDGIGSYIAKVEKNHIGLPDGLGFEKEFENSCRKTFKRFTAYAFWVGLLITTIVIPLLFQDP